MILLIHNHKVHINLIDIKNFCLIGKKLGKSQKVWCKAKEKVNFLRITLLKFGPYLGRGSEKKERFFNVKLLEWTNYCIKQHQ